MGYYFEFTHQLLRGYTPISPATESPQKNVSPHTKRCARARVCVCAAPPEFGQVSPGFVIAREGSTLELSCDASGIPAPTLTWLRDGKELARSARVSPSPAAGRLAIKSVVSADAGVYTCLFKNPVAQISHAIRVVVKGRSRVASALDESSHDHIL